MKSLEYPKEQRLAFTKYAELAWASYSTGFNEGMFGVDSKGNENSEIFLKREEEKKDNPTYHQAILSLKNTMSVLAILKPITSLHDLNYQDYLQSNYLYLSSLAFWHKYLLSHNVL